MNILDNELSVLYPKFVVGGHPVRPMTQSAFYAMLMDMSHVAESVDLEGVDDALIYQLLMDALGNGARLSLSGALCTFEGGCLCRDGVPVGDFDITMMSMVHEYRMEPVRLLEDGCYLACYASGTDYREKILELEV